MLEEKIVSAIMSKYIKQYLIEESDYFIDNIYYSKEWTIELIEKEARTMGKLHFPVNHVIFRSEYKDICDQIVRAFRMKFMSAGA